MPAAKSPARPRATIRSARFVRHPQQATGAATSSSAAKKKSTKKYRRHNRREPTQKAPTPERISEIQSALARNGDYDGEPTGKWDAKSIAALEKFQSANNLEPTGKFDALTLQKLGLGSDIAGVSAPKSLPPQSCCSVPPASSAPATSAPRNLPSDAPAPPPSKNKSSSTGTSSSKPPQH